jgi:AcrR family transcriptional regulator
VPRRKQRTSELRAHVVSVAMTLLGERGVGGFTTRTVAHEADTSTPAVYELFGDKWGLVREVFFEGFRLLRSYLDALKDSDDARADLIQMIAVYRRFIRENPGLSEVMFSRPFSDFDPHPSEREASGAVRVFIVERVRRAIGAGNLRGDATDIAHVLIALVQGLAAAENARRLGTTRESIDRRWELAVGAVLDGLAATER